MYVHTYIYIYEYIHVNKWIDRYMNKNSNDHSSSKIIWGLSRLLAKSQGGNQLHVKVCDELLAVGRGYATHVTELRHLNFDRGLGFDLGVGF